MDYRNRGLDDFCLYEQNIESRQRSRRGEVHTNTKRMRKKRQNKMKLYRTVAAGLVISAGFSIYGATTFTNKMIDRISDDLAASKEYHQKYVFTNLSDEQIKNMSFEEQCSLYEDYYDEVNQLATYSPEGVSPVNNYDYYRSKAHEGIASLNSGANIYGTEEATKRMVIEDYQKGLECIESLYNGKFSFNEVTPDSIILNSVNSNIDKTL